MIMHGITSSIEAYHRPLVDDIVEAARALEVPVTVLDDAVLQVHGMQPIEGSIKLAVSEEDRRQLERRGWRDDNQGHEHESIQSPDGRFEASTHWGPYSHTELRADATVIAGGVAVSSLRKVIDLKEYRIRTRGDVGVMQQVGTYLTHQVVDPRFMTKELAIARSLVPERLQQHPAVLMGAQALLLSGIFYGKGHHELRYYSGPREPVPTPAAWRTRLHSINVAYEGQRYADRTGMDDEARLTLLAAALWHDVRQAYGRGNDEDMTAEDYARVAELYDLTSPLFVLGGTAAIKATKFDERLRKQVVDPSLGYEKIQAGVAGPDFGVLYRYDGPWQSFGPMIENGHRAELEAKHGRVIAVELAAYNARRPSTEQIRPTDVRGFLQFIGRHGKESLEYAITFLEGQAHLYRTFEYPHGFELGQDHREGNARFMEQGVAELRKGTLTLEQLYDKAIMRASRIATDRASNIEHTPFKLGSHVVPAVQLAA